ncbi:hypothetical protein BDK51DRAFT_53074 [Blyttiomyces helicus]|uniref:Uncharacterized protein n=1 Tax=Blyttiomyces helicus TaxID=388810 RepID=A0A4P9VZC9_9FUNG|nr:hypothetical protein BDK51DRAFT_53074 [Blyttiomyces helicus]|eukprot:RKO85171.1 hypothetical protein BDK51DRAFT_53074 [Blyttiomyces helicus]
MVLVGDESDEGDKVERARADRILRDPDFGEKSQHRAKTMTECAPVCASDDNILASQANHVDGHRAGSAFGRVRSWAAGLRWTGHREPDLAPGPPSTARNTHTRPNPSAVPFCPASALGPITLLALSPDSSRLACDHSQCAVYVWDQIKRTLVWNMAPIAAVGENREGNMAILSLRPSVTLQFRVSWPAGSGSDRAGCAIASAAWTSQVQLFDGGSRR